MQVGKPNQGLSPGCTGCLVICLVILVLVVIGALMTPDAPERTAYMPPGPAPIMPASPEVSSPDPSYEEATADETGSEVTPEAAVSVADTVHITDTGTKYHAAGCGYLSKSDREVTRADAEAMGLTPCSVCNP